MLDVVGCGRCSRVCVACVYACICVINQYPICSDVFTQGSWGELDTVEDPELKELAASLPSLVLQSRAPATVKKYSGAFSRWKKWASSKPEIGCDLPPKPIHIALYLSFLVQRCKTSAPVMEAVSALSWANQIATVEDTTSHPLVQQVLAGAKRRLAHKTVKKEPITPEILAKMIDTFGKPDASLADVRTLTMCLVGYAGFFRFDELAKLNESDVKVYPEHMEIFVESSKTDQLREGAWVVIARTSSKLCPVTMMERYFTLAGIAGDPGKNLFRGICTTKSESKLRNSGGLSYTRAREVMLDMLSAIGLDKRQFGLHSLRAGGASAAANAGVADRFFKRHGRWRSENAKDGYVKDSLEERLRVSRNLGLSDAA